ncbi:tetratricopeptide repeat protein [Oscillatoria acuminata]|uniref:Capsular polysaccharide biosynthesis protein n=1 Tax=Oscillatoria acuminata PCC 6304 TaxID=56110 RepID=K9TI68_9CYAN|nr:tetratricopeptide repeat protein [Oscillatoria acuminata]AFY82098.1 capsular polysaccharide biosynthesis protein [Oscillatoria acuminata PCC 6304]
MHIDEATATNQQAERYYQEGKWTEAVALCHQLIQIQPNFAPIYKTLGNSLQAQGKLEAAMRAYHRALVLNPEFAEVHANQGTIFYQLGELDSAILCYQKALNLQPNWAGIYWNLGKVYKEQGRVEEGIAYQKTALTLNPSQFPPDLHNQVGVELSKRGNIEETTAFYKQFTETYPDCGPAYLNLGVFLESQGKIEEAFSCFQKAIMLQPNLAAGHFKLGYLLQQQNELESAIDCFKSTIELQPDWNEAHNNLGLVLRKINREEEAISSFKKAIEINPNFAEAYRNLGTTLQQQGKLEAAAACLRDCIKIQPNFALAHGNLGYVLEQQGKLDEAKASLRHAIALEPDLAMAYGNLGNILHREGELEESISCFQNAIKYDATFGNLYFRGQPHLEAIPRESLVELPVSSPKKICRSTQNLATQFHLNDPASEITYLEMSPRFSVHLAAGKTLAVEDEAVPTYFPETQGYSPETYLAILPNGRAWGDLYTSVIWSEDNTLLADLSTGNVPFLFALDKLPPVHKIEGTVAFLSTLGGDTYYHWWVDILPRLELLRRSGIDWNKIDKFVMNNVRHRFQQDIINTLNIPPEKLITSLDYPHIQATQLLVPSVTSSTEKWFGPFIEGPPKWVCDFLRERFASLADSQGSETPEKLYISRRKAKVRRFINEDEISTLLEFYGFKTVILESLSVQEQITLLAGAKTIIAPHGAGLTNTIFCQPGTQLLEIFSPRYVPDCYWIISNQVGLDYYYLMGDHGEKYYETYPHLRPKPVNRPPRAEDIFVNLDSLVQLMKLAAIV